MRINEESIKEFSLTGKDTKISNNLVFFMAVFIVIHGIIIAIFKQSIVFSVLLTLPFLLLFL
ncbi:MAG: hypothetical protein K2I73_00440, partial [Eubacterium sp.]|nr:hypothetical protein [Eubacterium sp.]